jgi:hypothetical protein
VFTNRQRRFLALMAAMGAAGAQVAAGFQGDPTNAQAAFFGLTIILTGIAGHLATSKKCLNLGLSLKWAEDFSGWQCFIRKTCTSVPLVAVVEGSELLGVRS